MMRLDMKRNSFIGNAEFFLHVLKEQCSNQEQAGEKRNLSLYGRNIGFLQKSFGNIQNRVQQTVCSEKENGSV